MAPKLPSTGPFPTAHSTTSFWRTGTNPIDDHRSTESLPPNADVVIIGAGFAGTSIAHHLTEESELHDRPIPSIVILEAREACSGATGRNGKLRDISIRHICVHSGGRSNTDSRPKVATSNRIRTLGRQASSKLMAKRSRSM